uniref:Uncharacterized protein n=1 Tax=Tetranychus urticae TaxID=32264 RepID=T1K7U0_TETUR
MFTSEAQFFGFMLSFMQRRRSEKMLG